MEYASVFVSHIFLYPEKKIIDLGYTYLVFFRYDLSGLAQGRSDQIKGLFMAFSAPQIIFLGLVTQS